MQHLYDYNHFKSLAQDKAIEAEQAKRTMLYIVFLCLIAISAIIVFFHQRKNRRKMIRQRINAKYATDMIVYTKLKSELDKSNNLSLSERQKLQEELLLVKESLQEAQTDSLNPDQWEVPDVLLDSPVITMFHKAAAQGRTVSDCSWNDIRLECRKYQPEFMQFVDTVNDSIYKTDFVDIQICILTKLRFSISEMQTLLQYNASGLSKRRSRLYKKLTGKEGSSSDFDKFIRSK